jgi:hypothetical protein
MGRKQSFVLNKLRLFSARTQLLFPLAQFVCMPGIPCGREGHHFLRALCAMTKLPRQTMRHVL